MNTKTEIAIVRYNLDRTHVVSAVVLSPFGDMAEATAKALELGVSVGDNESSLKGWAYGLVGIDANELRKSIARAKVEAAKAARVQMAEEDRNWSLSTHRPRWEEVAIYGDRGYPQYDWIDAGFRRLGASEEVEAQTTYREVNRDVFYATIRQRGMTLQQGVERATGGHCSRDGILRAWKDVDFSPIVGVDPLRERYCFIGETYYPSLREFQLYR